MPPSSHLAPDSVLPVARAGGLRGSTSADWVSALALDRRADHSASARRVAAASRDPALHRADDAAALGAPVSWPRARLHDADDLAAELRAARRSAESNHCVSLDRVVVVD